MKTISHADGSATVEPEPGVRFYCRDNYVARIVRLVASENYPDARWAQAVLNHYGASIPHEAETVLALARKEPK